MPSKNTIKEFVNDNFYHVYNRGVEKRVIFLDDQDYTTFLGIIKKYFTGKNNNYYNRHGFRIMSDNVQLIAFCLMPNHYHLLLRQLRDNGITDLMRRVNTAYAMYFNNK